MGVRNHQGHFLTLHQGGVLRLRGFQGFFLCVGWGERIHQKCSIPKMFGNTEFPKTLFPEFLSIHYSIKFSIPELQDSRSKTFREWPHPISHPVSNQVQISCILIYIYCNNSISIITLLSYCVSSLSPPTDSLTNVLQTTTYFYTVEMFALDNTSAANQEVGRILETMLRLVGVFFQTLNFFKNSITYMLFVMYLFLLVLECYSLVSVIKR